MAVWLSLIAVVAATLVLWRVSGVAGQIWRERAHANVQAAQMDAAASSGTVLCERLPDGTTLLVMPVPVGREQGGPEPERTIPALREIKAH